jgi:hypothetical protein
MTECGKTVPVGDVVSTEELRDSGYLFAANREFFHPLGLAISVDLSTNKLEVLDWRDDPEGGRFLDALLDDPEVIEKAKRFDLIRLKCQLRRIPLLGYWVQPMRQRS